MSTPLPTRASRRLAAQNGSSAAPGQVVSGPAVQGAAVQDAALPGPLIDQSQPAESSAENNEAGSNKRRSTVLITLLCALLGFAIVLQVRQTTTDQLSTLRQDDLIRLLEDVTVRSEQLEAEVARLSEIRSALLSGTDQQQAALEVAMQRATIEGILSGRLPAQGPGIELQISDPLHGLRASDLFNLLEELRNAGAEVVQVNDYRVTTSTAFTDGSGDIFLDGNVLPRELTWLVIGDPATLSRALEIPGGALPRIRLTGATVLVTPHDDVLVDAIARLRDAQFARPIVEAS